MASLYSLAFSDYQLWANPCLRDPNKDGFIPIRTLFRRSQLFLTEPHDDQSDVSVVKCLTTHANDFFDIQMIIVDRFQDQNLAGGYEIRRKDWVEVTLRFPSFSPQYWDARTVYIENIPHQYRSIVGICDLLRPILNSSPIQHIVFPPHHQDPPDAIPKCKGFALVTLTDPTLVSHLVTLFPYDTAHVPTTTDDDDLSPEESEAHKAGLRALHKENWDKLQAEYAEYRESLLRRIATEAPNKITGTTQQHGSERFPDPGPTSEPQSYPAGCVLFARRVPPGTNKTALRTRFSALLADPGALDYVDYTKGLDSCYLRLTTPEYAQELLKASRSEQGVSGQELELELELLEGRREEVYWENVPEKVRRLAVQRAHAQVHQPRKDVPGVGQDANGDDVAEDTVSATHASGSRRRKRRR